MAQGLKIYKRCDVCWGKGKIKKVVSLPGEPIEEIEIECSQCHGDKIIIWGCGYLRDESELPPEPS